MKAALGNGMLAIVVAVVVYFATNPYVLKHLLTDRAVLSANLGNSRAMYHADPFGGIRRAIELTADGAGVTTLFGGLASAAFFVGKLLQKREKALDFDALRCALLPISAHAAVVAAGFALLAAGKPGEYGRFGLSLDITLAILFAVVIGMLPHRRWRLLFGLIVILNSACVSLFYSLGFARDTFAMTDRDRLALTLNALPPSVSTIGLPDEPAPYLMPPVDLWRWEIILLPRDFDLKHSPKLAQVVVRPVDKPDDPTSLGKYVLQSRATRIIHTPISWADKPIETWIER